MNFKMGDAMIKSGQDIRLKFRDEPQPNDFSHIVQAEVPELNLLALENLVAHHFHFLLKEIGVVFLPDFIIFPSKFF